ncbi:hypothetical protein LEP1GSC170_1324 [Leptospira interrogans serovar Bataviae str. HAI135]|uniref:Uncharacterized protein n=1 Tax=Leptospira noguchii serovar Autumnalis str. ZUN142 TaxID=1085540 RepID=M6UIS1_9LEPT|nr:hypothetical protein LEP1GSC170_1324 [Leptospira interrogans serovar Bataviae str. HAI135]EMO42721.1 hypothetical protein LEP1GSC186_0814 [Leptospira noguchii serovar Autumnalis str. ZUN142]
MSHFNYEICERFAPIFLRRTHVKKNLYKNLKRVIIQNEFLHKIAVLRYRKNERIIYKDFLKLKLCPKP